MISGYCIIPNLSIATSTETLRSLPEMVFRLDIPPLFSVMSALVLADHGRGHRLDQVRDPGQDLLRDGTHHDRPGQPHHDPHPAPSSWACPSWAWPMRGSPQPASARVHHDGAHRHRGPLHLAGRALRHRRRPVRPQSLAGLPPLRACLPDRRGHHVQRRHPARGPGMRPQVPRPQPYHGGIHGAPGATVHLCGSVLTETFFVMTISLMLYGSLPSVGTMLLFCVLLGIFAVGAPGVPGGTVVASLGIVTGVLGFDPNGGGPAHRHLRPAGQLRHGLQRDRRRRPDPDAGRPVQPQWRTGALAGRGPGGKGLAVFSVPIV